jgi:hypothetical protein
MRRDQRGNNNTDSRDGLGDEVGHHDDDHPRNNGCARCVSRHENPGRQQDGAADIDPNGCRLQMSSAEPARWWP